MSNSKSVYTTISPFNRDCILRVDNKEIVRIKTDPAPFSEALDIR